MAVEFYKYVELLTPEKDVCPGHDHDRHESYAAQVTVAELERIRQINFCSEAKVGDYVALVSGGTLNLIPQAQFEELFPTPQKVLLPFQPTLDNTGWM